MAGVYVQVESVGLSRTIPRTFAWLINPPTKSVPRNALTQLLDTTRAAVVNRAESQPGLVGVYDRMEARDRQ